MVRACSAVREARAKVSSSTKTAFFRRSFWRDSKLEDISVRFVMAAVHLSSPFPFSSIFRCLLRPSVPPTIVLSVSTARPPPWKGPLRSGQSGPRQAPEPIAASVPCGPLGPTQTRAGLIQKKATIRKGNPIARVQSDDRQCRSHIKSLDHNKIYLDYILKYDMAVLIAILPYPTACKNERYRDKRLLCIEHGGKPRPISIISPGSI